MFRWYISTLNSGDYSPLFSSDSRVVGGYSFRTAGWCEKPIPVSVNNMLVDSIEYYQTDIKELNTWSEGETGLGWGTWIESYQHKGQAPEKARVRFTNTFRKYGNRWIRIMFHRDIQPFNEDGMYPKELTVEKGA